MSSVLFYVIGNKLDRVMTQNSVPNLHLKEAFDKLEHWCADKRVKYGVKMEHAFVSAKTGQNVMNVFTHVGWYVNEYRAAQMM